MDTISFKEAIKIAKETMLELFCDEQITELSLEEIELEERDRREIWAVTLGYYKKRSVSALKSPRSTLSFFAEEEPLKIENRVYKTLLIDAQTGSFIKMDMRIIK
jgi:hypothetical protein